MSFRSPRPSSKSLPAFALLIALTGSLVTYGQASAAKTSPKAGTTTTTTIATPQATQDEIGSGETPVLTRPVHPDPSVARTTDCAGLYTKGWKFTCDQVSTGSAVLTGVVEYKALKNGTTAWKATVWRLKGKMQIETLSAGSLTMDLWNWVSENAGSLVGKSHSQLVFGFENQGSGAILDLDVVNATGSGLTGGELSVYQGTATIPFAGSSKQPAGQIWTYHAVYKATDANCCPSGGFARDTVKIVKGVWTVVATNKIAAPTAKNPLPNNFVSP